MRSSLRLTQPLIVRPSGADGGAAFANVSPRFRYAIAG